MFRIHAEHAIRRQQRIALLERGEHSAGGPGRVDQRAHDDRRGVPAALPVGHVALKIRLRGELLVLDVGRDADDRDPAV